MPRRKRPRKKRTSTETPTKLTEADVFRMIRDRCPSDSWAVFYQVPNTTGAYRARVVDAIAMSLWPSRGLEVHGFEIKLRRDDWKKELHDPTKAESIARFCDKWWIVIGDESIIEDEELPPLWGLLVVKNGRLKTIKKAEPQKETPLSKGFIAALLRHAQREVKSAQSQAKHIWIKKSEVQAEINAAYQRGNEDGKRIASSDPQNWATKQKLQAVEKFEQASGVQIERWQGENIGKAVKYVLKAKGAKRAIDATKRSVDGLDQVVQRIKKELEEI